MFAVCLLVGLLALCLCRRRRVACLRAVPQQIPGVLEALVCPAACAGVVYVFLSHHNSCKALLPSKPRPGSLDGVPTKANGKTKDKTDRAE